MTLFLQILVLLAGSVLLSVMYENIAARGEETSFSLPLSNILLVAIMGTALSVFWGWRATAGILAAYGAFCVITGRLDA